MERRDQARSRVKFFIPAALAESSSSVRSGNFGLDIQLPDTVKRGLVEFIAGHLPRWRDHANRPHSSGETNLTAHLCAYLNGATRLSSVWSNIQFRTEVSDETEAIRKIDLAPQPLVSEIFVDNRRHTIFDHIFPIECKRLPTPQGKGRDEREYVFSTRGTGGGIQRYKFGYHGAAHKFAAMIAYVQSDSCPDWYTRINGWIRDLSAEPDSPWKVDDLLCELDGGSNGDVSRFESRHRRESIPGELEMQHVWILMN